MQTNSFRTKLYVSFLCLAILGQTYVNAQNASISNYLHQADNHADIFNGRIERMYHPTMYRNVPYFVNADFTEATIVYRNNYYPALQARLDLHRQQLVVLPPGRQHPIAIHSPNVNRVYIHNRIFVRLTPPARSGLDEGFYMLLVEGDNVQLFGKERYTLQRDLQQARVVLHFNREAQFFLRYNDQYHEVKNRRSITRLFPEHRREINNFSRANRLNFGRQNRAESLTRVVAYSETLINTTNKQ